jgi:hypothetical protein
LRSRTKRCFRRLNVLPTNASHWQRALLSSRMDTVRSRCTASVNFYSTALQLRTKSVPPAHRRRLRRHRRAIRHQPSHAPTSLDARIRACFRHHSGAMSYCGTSTTVRHGTDSGVRTCTTSATTQEPVGFVRATPDSPANSFLLHRPRLQPTRIRIVLVPESTTSGCTARPSATREPSNRLCTRASMRHLPARVLRLYKFRLQRTMTPMHSSAHTRTRRSSTNRARPRTFWTRHRVARMYQLPLRRLPNCPRRHSRRVRRRPLPYPHHGLHRRAPAGARGVRTFLRTRRRAPIRTQLNRISWFLDAYATMVNCSTKTVSGV